MVSSRATTVAQYLEELPGERRAVVSRLRAALAKAMPEGYVESMDWGMICWEIPLERCPQAYNGRPLGYVALAAQKHHYALYLMGVYADDRQARTLEAAFRTLGTKPDVGKSCVRFRRLEDIPLDAILGLVASMSVEDSLASHEKGRAGP